MSTREDIISNTMSIFQWYSKKTTPKFYGVKIDHKNQHSLSFALGLSRIELETLLKILDLAHMKGDKLIVHNERKWRSHSIIKKFLSGENAINFAQNANARAKNKMIFIQLGIPSKKIMTSQLRREDSVPCKNNYKLVKLRAKLKNSIQNYERVISRQEPIQTISPSLAGVEVETETSVAAISLEKEDLLSQYKKLGYGNDAEEILVSSNTNYKFPLLSKFNIPTAPIILRKIATEIIHLQQENRELNIIGTTESNRYGRSHAFANIRLLRLANK